MNNELDQNISNEIRNLVNKYFTVGRNYRDCVEVQHVKEVFEKLDENDNKYEYISREQFAKYLLHLGLTRDDSGIFNLKRNTRIWKRLMFP